MIMLGTSSAFWGYSDEHISTQAACNAGSTVSPSREGTTFSQILAFAAHTIGFACSAIRYRMPALSGSLAAGSFQDFRGEEPVQAAALMGWKHLGAACDRWPGGLRPSICGRPKTQPDPIGRRPE